MSQIAALKAVKSTIVRVQTSATISIKIQKMDLKQKNANSKPMTKQKKVMAFQRLIRFKLKPLSQ